MADTDTNVISIEQFKKKKEKKEEEDREETIRKCIEYAKTLTW